MSIPNPRPLSVCLVGSSLLALSTWAPGLCLPLDPSPRSQETDAERAAMARVDALEALTNSSGDEALAKFVETQLAPDFVAAMPKEELWKLLRDIRAKCGNAGGIGLERSGERGVRVQFESQSGRWVVTLSFAAGADARIAGLELRQGEAPPQLEPLQWDDVVARLEAYEAEGFAGSVLLVRGGQLVLDQGYGFANEALEARNDGETIFAIGSTPIDFTKAAILLLEQRGELDTADLVSMYFDDLPEDKAGMTLEHLMKGSSGLRNFHGIRGVDEDMDLSYIDRDEAMRRIFSSSLLFVPGRGQAHSHSAWGVLAAVVEIASGQSYADFLAEELFAPAGMKRTGLYPLCQKFPDAQVAVGGGPPALGQANTPKNWGPTSWLVMGSGGMVSTTHDLYKWLVALRAGKLLGPAALQEYWSGGVLAGANDRGFLTVYTEGPEQLAIFCSNSFVQPGGLEDQLGEALAKLALR